MGFVIGSDFGFCVLGGNNSQFKPKKMREIKFRAWVNDGYMAIQGTPDLETLSSFMFHYSDQEKLMQFTGLQDRDGNDVYEGDILETADRILKVVWHKYAGQWDTDFIRYKGELSSNGLRNLEWKYKATVIGNIYENPELL